MARAIKNRKLDSRTARRSIPQSKFTHWAPISRGRALGYRRGRRGGAWVARFDAEGLRREEKLGEADDVLDADGIQILNYAQALAKANGFFNSCLTAATGETPRGGPYSVQAAVEDYLESLKNRAAPDHRGAVYDFNRNVLPFLGEIQVGKLTRARLEAWRSQLASRPRLSRKKSSEDRPGQPPKSMTDDEKRARQATTNRTVRRLVAALNLALVTGKVHANALTWRLRPFENAEIARANFLSESEQQNFIKACAQEGKHFQNLALAALHTGCRYSELARLKAQDFIPSGPSVFVATSKVGKSRHVFLDADGEQFFRTLSENRPQNAILLPRKDGGEWSKDGVKKQMRRTLKIAGLKRIQFHSLRHSFATRLLMRGITMQVTAKMLGHSSVKMIERNYGHLTDEHIQKVIASLPSAGLNKAAAARQARVVAIPQLHQTA